MLAEISLKELVKSTAKAKGLTMQKMATAADMSLRQFVTVVNSGFTEGTRLGTIQKMAEVLETKPSELIRLTIEE